MNNCIVYRHDLWSEDRADQAGMGRVDLKPSKRSCLLNNRYGLYQIYDSIFSLHYCIGNIHPSNSRYHLDVSVIIKRAPDHLQDYYNERWHLHQSISYKVVLWTGSAFSTCPYLSIPLGCSLFWIANIT